MVHPLPERVQVELLGGFTVTVGARVVSNAAWPSRRSAELVGLLALSDRHRLMRDQAIEALWPHLDFDAGAANLRKAAHHARQALGRDDAVVLSGGRVALLPGCEVETDVAGFERCAEAALRSRERAVCIEAAAGYAGDLLPDSLYEDWTQPRRDSLRSRYVALLRLGGRWERLVEIDPSDEQAHCELMRAALAAGSRPAAIRWYGRLRTNLRRELGVAPDPQSRALYEECVVGLGPAAMAVVGREVELAQLAAGLRSAERGELGAVVLRGLAGMGKSTLCRQLASLAQERGWFVVTVAATAGSGPYSSLVGVVEQLLDHDRTLLDELPGSARSTLTALTASAEQARPQEGGLTRHMVIGAVRQLVAACRNVAGVVLFVDDAHLADDATVEAWEHLARAGGGPPFVGALAFRPEAAPQQLVHAVAGLERAGRCLGIDLVPLDDDEVAVLVEAGARMRPAPGVLARIVEMAQGNPFFALELTRGIGPGAVVAPSVWEAITERFLDLDDATAAMLRRLAVAGDDLDPVSVPALTGLAESDAFALLDVALGSGVLVVSGARYRFRHDLVRQALAAQVAPHHRIAIHRDTARGLAAAGAAPALVARHWLEGRRPQDAVPWLLVAARRAVALGAFTDALGHLELLLEHQPTLLEALRVRAEVLDALGDGRAPAAYAAAARTVGGSESEDLRAMQALAQIKQGDPPGALRTLDGLQPGSVQGRLAQALTLSGAAIMGFADPELGTVKAAECRRLALESGDRTTLVVASWAQAAAAHARDDLRESLWVDLLDTHALRELAISVFDGHLCMTQRLLYGARPYPDVVAFADSFLAEAQRLGAARGRAFAVTLRGEAKLLSGWLEEADEDLREGARLNRAIGAATGEALALQRRAEVALHRGHPHAAHALLDEALAVARESDVGFHLFDRIYGTKITAAGDPGAALIMLAEAELGIRGPLETCPGCRITLAVPAAIAAARAGDLDRAAHYAQTTETLAGVVMRLPGWDAALEEVRGHLAAAEGGGAEATARFRAAAEGFRDAGQPLDQARCAALARCRA
ncbi:AAA family ATPase [Pseudonocardia sp. KRD-169]|uniref:AAA family ATPase n=2 Tax=Pseudonocardia abyssalis TaxID=2792008 RepID=A0ABS6V277_9PSEU|nr:AAA family ATPase [Pseudonocardia abyssalis]MBW0138603.1 AAA family ATPase [Pseudonocardia abyssalis]